jgi:ketosteroid isomerase-like protein
VTDASADVVRRYFAAINRDDVPAMLAELDEAVTWRTPAIHPITPARELRGHDAVRQVWNEVKDSANGSLRVSLTHIEEDRRGLLVDAVLVGPGFTTPVSYVIEVGDGRITEADTFPNPRQARTAWAARSSGETA